MFIVCSEQEILKTDESFDSSVFWELREMHSKRVITRYIEKSPDQRTQRQFLIWRFLICTLFVLIRSMVIELLKYFHFSVWFSMTDFPLLSIFLVKVNFYLYESFCFTQELKKGGASFKFFSCLGQTAITEDFQITFNFIQ